MKSGNKQDTNRRDEQKNKIKIMAISYQKVDLKGNKLEEIQAEIFHSNDTVGKGYVNFADNIKAGTLFTENKINVSAQPYTGQALTSAGSIEMKDRFVYPFKFEYKQDFLQEDLRSSRFAESMAKGAWNIESNEFGSKVLFNYGPKVSADAEVKFWNSITATTKSFIAGSSYSAGVKAYAAALPVGNFDGVIANVLAQDGVLQTPNMITGTAITPANIAAEYAKVFSAQNIGSLLDSTDGGPVYFYAPLNHKQLILIANNSVGAAQQINFFNSGDTFSYNGVEIKFVPLMADVILAHKMDRVFWCTDLLGDENMFNVDKKSNDSDVQFVRCIYTLTAHVANIDKAVLYIK